jgi:NAD(P)-dependent dehydrogenase (short-subunit alcohol dehydrogenase family)
VNTFDFSGKVALVTGGSGGIGRATALLFAQSSAKVVIGDVDPAGEETVEAIKRDGGEAVFVKSDVSDEGDVKKSDCDSSQDLRRIALRVQQRRCSASDRNSR